MFSAFRIGDLGPPPLAGQPARVALLSPDLRITNHRDIAATLGLDPACSPAELLLAGWHRWGESLPAHLRGGFAFVIADHATNTLYAARDHFGMAPLFWQEAGGAVHFATSSSELRQNTAHSLPDDEGMLVDFIAGEYIERARTFFEGVSRFPEAHWVRFSPVGKRVERYWSLADVPRSVVHDHPAERFRELFDRSVAASASAGKAAIMLSGGLDSSTIAASLYGLGTSPDLALSITYDDSEGWCDRPHLQAVAQRTGLSLHTVPADSHDPLQDMDFWLRTVDGPHLPRGHSVSMQLLPMARAMGCDILFNGHGGDEIVSYGFGRYNELARAGKWLRLWRETEAAAALYGDDRRVIFQRYLSHIRPLRPLLRKLARRAAPPAVVDAGFLDPAVAQAADPDRYSHRTAMSRIEHDERMVQEEVLSGALQPGSLEVFALCSRAAGVAMRMPFYDVDLLEFSLSLPSEWKLRDGLSRYILRAAFAGDLPEATLRRQDKYDFSGPFLRGLVAQQEKVLDFTDPARADPWKIVNRARLEQARNSLCRDGTGMSSADAAFLWRVAILGIWSGISKEPPQAPEMLGGNGANDVQV